MSENVAHIYLYLSNETDDIVNHNWTTCYIGMLKSFYNLFNFNYHAYDLILMIYFSILF